MRFGMSRPSFPSKISTCAGCSFWMPDDEAIASSDFFGVSSTILMEMSASWLGEVSGASAVGVVLELSSPVSFRNSVVSVFGAKSKCDNSKSVVAVFCRRRCLSSNLS